MVESFTRLTRARVLLLCCGLVICTTCLFFGVSNNEDKASTGVINEIKSRLRRAVYGRQLWPNGTIPYVIDCTVLNVPLGQKVIIAAMKEWQNRTCVRFVNRTNERGYLLIRRHRGCWGDIGYSRGPVVLSMGDGCEFKYVMLHELGHVIGFYHEHNRADRDSFVKIMWNNILGSMLDQFGKRRKLDEFENELPYDYSSIMHYRFFAFSKNRSLDTLELKTNSTKRHTPYTTLSDLDVQKAKDMYECPQHTPTKEPTKPVEEEAINITFDNSYATANVFLQSPSLATNKSEMNASILVYGKEYALNVEGMNIVLVNYLSGNVTLTTAYPVTSRPGGYSLAKFIENIPKRTYFLIVSKLHSFYYLRSAAEALRGIGLQPGPIEAGSSLCAVGYKGDGQHSIKQTINGPDDGNATTLSMNITLAYDYKCQDDLLSCNSKAKKGDCDRYPFHVLNVCQRACKACVPGKPCMDEQKNCKLWAQNDSCKKYPKYMLRNCKVSCGTCRKALPAAKNEENKQVVGEPESKERFRGISEERARRCLDKNRYCVNWKRSGRCRTDVWVRRNCVLSCNSEEFCIIRFQKPNKTKGGENIEEKEKKSAERAKRCVNRSNHCRSWKRSGRCLTDHWVRRNCVLSCKSDALCITKPNKRKEINQEKFAKRLEKARRCVDRSYRCKVWKISGRCSTDFWVRKHCVLSCESHELCVKKSKRRENRRKRKKFKPVGKKKGKKKEKKKLNIDDEEKEGKKKQVVEENKEMEKKPTTENKVTEDENEQVSTKNKEKEKKSKTDDEEKEHEKKPPPRGRRCVDKSSHCFNWRNYGRCSTDPWVWKNCLSSCDTLEICTRMPIRPKGACSRPFGIGWYQTIPDSAFNASSALRTSGNWSAAANNARLYMEDDYSSLRIGSWCSRGRPYNEWLSVDFGRIKTVTAVATQGRFRYYEHVKTFWLSHSVNGVKWTYIRRGQRVKIFQANCDHMTPVINSLGRSINARFIRFHPRGYYGAVCMRVEVFGCG